MRKFTVALTDDERQTLDRERARLGLRSEADVIRQWVAQAATYYVRVGAEYEHREFEPGSPYQDYAGDEITVLPARAHETAAEVSLTEGIVAERIAAPPPKPAGPARTAKAYIRTMKRKTAGGRAGSRFPG